MAIYGIKYHHNMDILNPDEGKRTWTSLVKMENNVPVKIDNTPLLTWKTDSANVPSDEYFASQGYYGYIINDEVSTELLNQCDHKMQKIVLCDLNECEVDHINKTVTARKKIVDLTAKEYFQKWNDKIDSILKMRDEKIEQSKWTQNDSQSPEFKQKWDNYRKQLMSISIDNINDPFDFVWPSHPGIGPNSDDEVIDLAKVVQYFLPLD